MAMQHRQNPLISAVFAAALCVITTGALAGEPVTWTFDETTTGQDIHWVSPTPAQPDALQYDGVYDLTGVWVTVPFFGNPIEVNVTELIPPEYRHGTGSAPGPCPVLLVSQYVAYPLPPEPPSIAADLAISLDADGYGHVDATNIVLGEINVGFGTVQIDALRIAGQVTITPIGTFIASDINRDGVVNVQDLLLLLAAWGECPPPPAECPADVNGDGVVNVSDLLQVLSDWS